MNTDDSVTHVMNTVYILTLIEGVYVIYSGYCIEMNMV